MKKTKTRLLALFLGLIAIIILGVVVFPMLYYEVYSRQHYPLLLSPVPDSDGTNSTFSAVMADFTKASNWFVGAAKSEDFMSDKIEYYSLSVPKLKIDAKAVTIGGEDLSNTLIHYPGTALPGKIGNAVIFGHSVLPWFFNPDDYKTIFSTLPTLKKGDDISVNYDGIMYRYRVENMFEVLPTDIQILEQNTTGSYITLVTCTPPGHPLKPRRLIVRAKLIPYADIDK